MDTPVSRVSHPNTVRFFEAEDVEAKADAGSHQGHQSLDRNRTDWPYNSPKNSSGCKEWLRAIFSSHHKFKNSGPVDSIMWDNDTQLKLPLQLCETSCWETGESLKGSLLEELDQIGLYQERLSMN